MELSYRHAYVITPHDTNDLAIPASSIYCCATGDLTVIPYGDSVAVTFSDVPVGTIIPIRVSRVLDTGTDAGPWVALW